VKQQQTQNGNTGQKQVACAILMESVDRMTFAGELSEAGSVRN
jgi:hypothetical protein